MRVDHDSGTRGQRMTFALDMRNYRYKHHVEPPQQNRARE